MVRNWIKTTMILFAIWMMLSARLEPKLLAAGIISSFIIAFFCQPLLWIGETAHGRRRFLLSINLWQFILYLGWFFGEMIKSILSVSCALVKINIPLEPHLITFRCVYQNPVATVFLTNSMILTPSTLTIEVKEDNTFVVHALTKKAADTLLSGNLQQRIGKIFDEEVEVLS
ncbi:multicomponent Na+:H+ antiporter subunit E [Clostridiales Family XIII bacterium PM5-7]